jgi:hypothetical protein
MSLCEWLTPSMGLGDAAEPPGVVHVPWPRRLDAELI